ncbi:MAG: hypothetical protein PHP11_05240 [Erysipelotrichaceae bacterium]|nr:hypothetical protein [Erysipelotrichaceae bacterium]MDD3924485.1 hypothetical protein [Erysipelotrichaceae bacterium]MDD4642559.1 hypothetical protein [Erysipelotrichaceae bacterium]
MAVRKRKIKRLKYTALALLLFVLSFGLFLFTSIYLRTYNLSLVQKTVECNERIEVMKTQNESLALEIQQLSAYDRVMAIAHEDDLVLNQENIVMVQD